MQTQRSQRQAKQEIARLHQELMTCGVCLANIAGTCTCLNQQHKFAQLAAVCNTHLAITCWRILTHSCIGESTCPSLAHEVMLDHHVLS